MKKRMSKEFTGPRTADNDIIRCMLETHPKFALLILIYFHISIGCNLVTRKCALVACSELITT